MDDFKVMARLLAAIKASEELRSFSADMVSPKVLRTTEAKRDSIAVKLQRSGYVEGLSIVDDIDNAPYPAVMWGASSPTVTIKGLEFIQTCSPLRKAGAEIKDIGENIAAKAISSAMSDMF